MLRADQPVDSRRRKRAAQRSRNRNGVARCRRGRRGERGGRRFTESPVASRQSSVTSRSLARLRSDGPERSRRVVASRRDRDSIARRVVLGIADNRRAAAVGRPRRRAPAPVSDGVVGALAVHVGPQRGAADRAHGRLCRKRRRSPRARSAATSSARSDGRAGSGRPVAFQALRPIDRRCTATIRRSASAAAPSQISHVADVQQVEAAVGQRNAVAPAVAFASDDLDELGFADHSSTQS